MENKTYTKVSFGSSNQKDNLQGRIWLEGTQKEIVERLETKGFNVLTKRPSRAIEKPAKAPKVAKAKKAKKELVAA